MPMRDADDHVVFDRRSGPAHGVRQPARPDWGSIGDRGHGVQFYADDAALIDRLAGHVGTALVCGDAAVVIATRAHEAALHKSLRRRGFNPHIARREGRYITLDAETSLHAIIVAGWPDHGRFQAAIAPVIDRAAAAVGRPHPRVAAFGEMVALLWAMGKPPAALRLEELWNELGRTREFSLCCAYPMSGFTALQDAAAFMKICAQHSHVFPVERRARNVPQTM